MGQVFTTFRGGFGDCWAAASFFASPARGDSISLYNLDSRIAMILPLFASNVRITEVERQADTAFMSHADLPDFESEHGYIPHEIIPWRTLFALPYLSTRVRWSGRKSRQIVYQLEPREQGPTSCEPAEVEKFISHLRTLGLVPIPIGIPMSPQQIVNTVSESGLFVGIDSGMSHLCHSVGIPSVIIRNRLPLGYLQVTHAGKRFDEFPDLRTFLLTFNLYAERYLM